MQGARQTATAYKSLIPISALTSSASSSLFLFGQPFIVILLHSLVDPLS